MKQRFSVKQHLHIIAECGEVLRHDQLTERTSGSQAIYTFAKTGRWAYDAITDTLSKTFNRRTGGKKKIEALKTLGIQSYAFVG